MIIKTPLVSVLMTAYNREEYIAEAIESVLASTYSNFELIIVDDGSSDTTVETARDFEKKDKRIKVYENEKNSGDYPNRNKAASYAKGEYLKYLDSDDTIYPWGLEAMVSCMERYPEAGFGLIAQNFTVNKQFPWNLSPVEAYRNYFFFGRLISMGPTGSIIKTAAFNSVGGFSGKQYVGDTELWLLLSKSYDVVLMPRELVWWREHEGQQIKSEYANLEVICQRYQLKKSFLNSHDCPLPENERQMAVRNMLNLYCRNILSEIKRGHLKHATLLKKYANISSHNLYKSLERNKYPKS